MTKKNRKTAEEKKAEKESEEITPESTESGQAGDEASAASSSEAEPQAETADSAESAADEVSMDDLLDDVRRSLIETETQAEEQKKPRWWNRLSRGGQKEQGRQEGETIASVPEPVLQPQEEQPDEYVDQIDELIDMLDTESKLKAVQTPTEEAAPVEPVAEPAEPEIPEAPVDVEELKKRVFNQREPEQEQELSEVRSIALEGGGEDVFVEVEASRADTAVERRRALENAVRPYLRYLYAGLAVVAVVLAVAVAAVLLQVYRRTLPQPTQVASNLPFPRTMTLPGGLNFTLRKGAIVNGAWNPRGPEWLEGTEICRWVAIPWSTQLEAVVRTLTQKDTIELGMSNNDQLTYTVYSIQQLTLAEMQALDQNSPCLLLVLAKEDSEKRWVVTAKP